MPAAVRNLMRGIRGLRPRACVSERKLFWRAREDADTTKWDKDSWPLSMGNDWPFGRKKYGKVEFVLLQLGRLARNYVSITELELAHVQMFPSHLLRLVTQGLSHCRDIQMLNLKNTRIGRGRGIEFLLAWQHRASYAHDQLLTDVNIAYGNLGRRGADLIMMVAMMNGLEQLNLCGCEIRDSGTRQIAQYLLTATRLTDLILSFNIITDQGTHRLADDLGLCVSLRCLDLSNNDINMDRARALEDASRHCTTLTRLFLNNHAFFLNNNA